MPGTRGLLPRGLLRGAFIRRDPVLFQGKLGGEEWMEGQRHREAIKTKENKDVGAILMNKGVEAISSLSSSSPHIPVKIL